MLLGRFEEAWRESERIAQRGGPDPHRLWDGHPFTGKRVIIRCLHGFGDAIQFVRYARLVRREATRVIVQTHPQLVSLFRGIPFVDEVITWDAGPGVRSVDWDQQIEVMELPRAFGTTLATIPAEIPYIKVAERYRERTRRALGPKRRPRIGLLWESGEWNEARNVPFEELRPILEGTPADFYSFQRGSGRNVLAASEFAGRVHDLSGDSPDVAHFAADLLYMDLLITVDTMAAHLAGALGRPVWVLLPFEADWRWMLDRRDTPWYPTMRLFRQRVRENWRWPVRQVLRELEEFLEGGVTQALTA
jgi:hypothetical protein